MGVDLETYRARIGKFVPGLSKGARHSAAFVFFLVGLLCGALIFIKALLLVQGIEPNPGPSTLHLKTWLLGVITGIVTTFLVVKVMESMNHPRQQAGQQQLLEDQQLEEDQQRVENHQQLAEDQQRVENHQQPVEDQQRVENHHQLVEDQQRVENRQLLVEDQQRFENHQQLVGNQQLVEDQQLVGNQKRVENHQQLVGDQQIVEDQQLVGNQQRVENHQQLVEDQLLVEDQQLVENQQRVENHQQLVKDQQLVENQQRFENHQQLVGNQQRVENHQQLVEDQQRVENHQQLLEDQQSCTVTVREVCNETVMQKAKMNVSFRTAPENLFIGDGNTVITVARSGIRGQPRSLIEQTKAWIREKRKTNLPCVPTAALRDAKNCLMNNKLVVIRGNSGDGKTHIATELLQWLMNEDSCEGRPKKEPISVPQLETLNTFTPHSDLAILIDDMFGFGGSRSQCDVDWWRSRASFIKPLLEGDIAGSANCMIITIRTDTLNEFPLVLSTDSWIDFHQGVDLATSTDALDRERKQMLNTFVKEIDNVPDFKEKEWDEIIKCSPGIGFPQCCRVFIETPELHGDRGEFFKNPLKHLFNVIETKLHEQKQLALLYLLFSENPVTETSLNTVGGEDKTIIDTVEKAFSISLNKTSQTSSSTNLEFFSRTKKFQYLKSGLESLRDSFVLKENGIYRFKHASIEDAVALLYGQVSPGGFLRNCSSYCLRYIVVQQPDNISQKIVISKELFSDLYKRIIQELDSDDEIRYTNVACMSPWTDDRFLTGFFEWILTNRKDWLGKHAQKYQTKDKYSFVVFVSKFNCLPFLRKVVLTDNPFSKLQMKCALDEALRAGSVGTASFLLEEGGVKPDVYSCFSAIEGGKLDLLKKLEIFDVITEVGEIDVLETLSKTIFLNAMLHSAKYDYPGLSVNAVDVACLYRHRDILEWLLTKYPMLLEKTKRKNDIDILHIAAVSGNVDLYKTIADLILKNKSEIECDEYLKTVDFKGHTVLHGACIAGSKDLVMYICKTFPFLLSQKDKYLCHCLHHAAGSRSLSCYQATESVVLEGKTDEERRDFIETLTNDNESTVLHIASLNGSLDICMYLCRSYPSLIALRNKQGNHCLHLASQSGSLRCFKALESVTQEDKTERQYVLEALTDEDQNTVLHVASMYGNKDICMYLCNTFPSLMELRNKKAWHFLHSAAHSGCLGCYKALETVMLEGKTDTECHDFMQNLRDEEGNSVLHVACMNGCKFICMYLCRLYPSLTDLRNNHGFHSLHAVVQSGSLIGYEKLQSTLYEGKPGEYRDSIIRSINHSNMSVLHVVSMNGSEDIYVLLCNALEK